MALLRRDEPSTEVSLYFVAWAEHDTSEGRGGVVEIGAYTRLDEALAAARHRGVQGSDGYVTLRTWRLFHGGLVASQDEPVTSHHQISHHRWGVGFVGRWADPDVRAREAEMTQ